jgi:two-component system, NtrC family, sensor kinase
VYVDASLSRATILEAWQRRTTLLAAFTFPTAMALIYIAWVALRRTQRELAAVRKLHEETEHRARAENALRQVQKLEALGRLTGGVAHDFNNLLMVISNNLHLLRRVEPSLAGSRQLAAIGRAVTSGERLTRQLLAFARRQPLHPEVLSLQERLPVLLALVAPTLGPRIEGQCVVDPDTPSIEVDAAELELAIINLAVNAKDAMPEGGQFRLSARSARPEETGLPGDFVVISVADTGAGSIPTSSSGCSIRSSRPSRTGRAPASASARSMAFARRRAARRALNRRRAAAPRSSSSCRRPRASGTARRSKRRPRRRRSTARCCSSRTTKTSRA